MHDIRTIVSACAGSGVALGLALYAATPTAMLMRGETVLPKAQIAHPASPEAPGFFSVPDTHAPLYSYVDGRRTPVFENVYDERANASAELTPDPLYEQRVPEAPVPDGSVIEISRDGAAAIRSAMVTISPLEIVLPAAQTADTVPTQEPVPLAAFSD